MTRAYLSSSVLYSVGRLVVRSPHSCGFGSGCSGRAAGIDEDADHHRDFAAVDQVVHHVLARGRRLRVHERLAIVEDHQAGRDRRVVLRRHVDPVRMRRAGIGFAGQGEGAANFAFRNAVLRQGIGSEMVVDVGLGISDGDWAATRPARVSAREKHPSVYLKVMNRSADRFNTRADEGGETWDNSRRRDS